MKVLVTGGCGYIGSHTCVELLNNNYDVIVIDNLSNSKKNVPSRIEKITNKEITVYEDDLCDKEALKTIFSENEIAAVIHLAGEKGLDKANKNAIDFYRNNVAATINLIEVMNEYNCKKLVFGSSAMVYGDEHKSQISESADPSPDNIIGYSKMMCEKILLDVYENDPIWSIAVLRHFNPAGAHPTGLLGENIDDMPSTLIPRLVKVATGNMEELEIYGNDYDTEDGTGRRDYTHVCDVARAHVKALEKVLSTREYDCYNLGTGYSHSVLDVIKIFETVNDVKINYTIKERRKGDAPICFADPDYSIRKLGWAAEKDLGDICSDSYNYIIKEYIDNDDEEEYEYDE
ncbi:MAG: UDP-glucose 4-epimerase GalE [Candidatus Coprovivens sp.]